MSNQYYITQPARERFEEKISMEPNTGCWLWTSYANKEGYGQFSIKKSTTTPAHRWAWQFYIGPVPEGLHVLHKCDTPACVNPLHLFLGTDLDNMRDCMKKGRYRSHFLGHQKGEENHAAKLTDEMVLQMRQSGKDAVTLAKEYGVHWRNVYKIISRETWKHI